MRDPGAAATVAIVVAAGSGERFGGEGKAFVELRGEPLVVHAVRALATSGVIDAIVVVVEAEAIGRATDVLHRAGLEVASVTAGGVSRPDSVRLGLGACPPDAAIVAVHDAARPLVSPELVARTVTALEGGWLAVAPGLPVVDTVKVVDDSRVVRTLDRRGLWAVQTPQVFARQTLRRVHTPSAEPPATSGGVPVTDDLMLVERAGGAVRVIPGERRNLKITYPEDLAIAEALLASGHVR